MAFYLLTFSEFKNVHNGASIPAATKENGSIFNAERAKYALERYIGAGASDAALTELSNEEHRAYLLQRLPCSVTR